MIEINNLQLPETDEEYSYVELAGTCSLSSFIHELHAAVVISNNDDIAVKLSSWLYHQKYYQYDVHHISNGVRIGRGKPNLSLIKVHRKWYYLLESIAISNVAKDLYG